MCYLATIKLIIKLEIITDKIISKFTFYNKAILNNWHQWKIRNIGKYFKINVNEGILR